MEIIMKALFNDGVVRETEDEVSVVRHTCSHVLAQAVKRLYPDAKLAIGPSISNGFYYDFDREGGFTPEDLTALEGEMKKIISLLAAVAISTSVSVPAFANEISVTVNGNPVVFPDQQPVKTESYRVLVPLRAIFEALGATVDWNEKNQSVISKKNGKTIQVTINSLTMLCDGKIKTLDEPARLINGRTMVPVRAVSEGLGAKVEWDDATQTVIIK